MSKAYLLIKDKKFRHTYSDNIKEKLVKDGWIYVGSVMGFNLSFYHENDNLTFRERRAYLKNALKQLDKEECAVR